MIFTTSKKMIVAGVLTLSILTAGIPAAMAEEEAPSAEASVAFLSKYVWRGFELSKDSLVIQPSLSVSYMGFGANLWANLDTDLYGTDTNKWNETDLTLSYDGAIDKFGYGAGWIYYALDSVADTQELYATFSYDVILAPSLTIYYDIDDFSGDWYANLGIGHSFSLTETVSLDLGLSVGYSDNDTYNAFQDGLLSASISFPVGKYVSITPELYYSFALSSDAENAIMNPAMSNDDSFVYGGVSASFSF